MDESTLSSWAVDWLIRDRPDDTIERDAKQQKSQTSTSQTLVCTQIN